MASTIHHSIREDRLHDQERDIRLAHLMKLAEIEIVVCVLGMIAAFAAIAILI